MVVAEATIIAIAIAWALFAGANMSSNNSGLDTGWTATDYYTAGTYDDPPISIIVIEHIANSQVWGRVDGVDVGTYQHRYSIISRNSSGDEMILQGRTYALMLRDADEATLTADNILTARQQAGERDSPPIGPDTPSPGGLPDLPPTGDAPPTDTPPPSPLGPLPSTAGISSSGAASPVVGGTNQFRRMRGGNY